MSGQKDCISASKVHTQKRLILFFVTCKNYKKTSKCKYWLLKVLHFETQMVCSGWLKENSLCFCVSAHQNVLLLVDAMDWDLKKKDLIKDVYSPENNKYIMHRYESCPGTATLKEFFGQELKEHEDNCGNSLLSVEHYGSSNIDNNYSHL